LRVIVAFTTVYAVSSGAEPGYLPARAGGIEVRASLGHPVILAVWEQPRRRGAPWPFL